MIGQSWTQESLAQAVSILGWDVVNDDLEINIGVVLTVASISQRMLTQVGQNHMAQLHTIRMHLLLSRIGRGHPLSHPPLTPN